MVFWCISGTTTSCNNQSADRSTALCTYRGAVVVVGVRVVVVRVHAGQHGAAGRTAHRRRHEGVVEVSAAILEDPACFRHVVQRAYKHTQITHNYTLCEENVLNV